MKSVLVPVIVMFLTFVQSPELFASESKQMRAEAEQHYADKEYKKAFKVYNKLAKFGDRYSQRRVAHMYAEGEGKKVNLTESYAWAALVAEGKAEKLAELNESLLPQLENASKAKKKAKKLIKKYGKEAQRERIAKHNKRGRVVDEGSCTGSKLACPRN